MRELLPDDQEYFADGFKAVSDGNGALDVAWANVTHPNGSLSSMDLLVGAGSTLKAAGILQVIERSLTNQVVAAGGAEISFWIYMISTNGALPIDFYFLKSTDNSDSPNADPVTAWTADGSKPTFGNDWEEVDTSLTGRALTRLGQ